MGSKPVAVPAAPPVVTATASVAPEKSIAVLPFVDMSEKKDQEYFAEGISEELIDTLAKLPELHVAARTSSFYFKGRPSTVAEIGKALGVGNILEGSVRKDGDKLRITVQLVQARNGYHLWSDTYDRNVHDIFRTQDEIAASVAGALRLRLLASALPSRGGAENVDAYNVVLQGRFFSRVGDHQKARDYYQRAIALDPSYALAWAWLSYEWFYVPSNKVRAREAAMRAVELQPNHPDGHVALGQVHYFVDWNWAAADAEFKQALALDPNNSWALAYSGDLSYSLGHFQEAILQLQRAAERDPFNAYAANSLGDALWAAGRLDEAARVYGQVLGLSPNDAKAREARALVWMAQGNVQAALSDLQQVSGGARQLQGLAILYFAIGRKAESDRALAELSAKYTHEYPTWIAEVHAYRHEPDAAFEWLERAYRERDLWLAYRSADPLLANLHGDPRYKALLRKMNLPE